MKKIFRIALVVLTALALASCTGYENSTLGTVETPVISDVMDNAVTITCETEGATIYYTTDGTTPTTSSSVYSSSSSIALTSTVIIKAYAVKEGYTDSKVASKECTYGSSSSSSITLDETGVEYFQVPLTVTSGTTVTVNVTGTNNGTTGFRSWLINDSQTTNSNLYTGFKSDGDDYVTGDFDITYELTATADSTYLFFKGLLYGTNIERLTVESLSVIIDGTTTEHIPSLTTVY